MDMRVSSDEIRSYVSAQTRIAKQALPEESRRVVLRLPTDSVNISPAARALQKGSLRVAMDDDGRFTKVTDDNSNPMMQLFDDGMSDIKEHLDKMKELTELMEDPTLSIEDRYATQMKLVEQEGELEKDTHDVYEKYMKMIHDFTRGKVADLWGAPKGATPSMDLVRAMESGKPFGGSRNYYLTDRVTGEPVAYSKYNDMIDKRTELKKEAIKRVMMRELDPEAWKKEEEKLREAFRKEFKDKADEYGRLPDELLPKQPIDDLAEEYSVPNVVDLTAETGDATSPQGKTDVFKPETMTDVELSDVELSMPPGWADEVVSVKPEVNDYELRMEKYVEERLAKLEEEDYKEFNAMRVSVMSASLAKESSNFVENLTNQLTEQFQRFAAQNELIGEKTPSETRGEVGQLTMHTMNFLKKTILDGMQKDTVREDKGGYNIKSEKTDDPMNGVRDIFAPVEMPRWEAWKMYRPDLFAGGSAEA